ncbi:hypothetical protein PCC7424_1787 [Gloeothece citriformis PCC 7424]|uniref:Uncharacterized protein n=1 Tax=Gloeothece citriformis (strain PCC 7424) TaxID=65393 RepID=B7KCB6_GLOC7|nr:hypothetical protein [Gloeothece citriformis]ACK70221.1 hypothetical protein PCC7424_1787 [Gloeothece citriformis PCC 7424]
MLPENKNPKIDYSNASEQPNSMNPTTSSSEKREELPDDHLPKSNDNEANPDDRLKTVADDQIITANIHAG